MDPRKKLEVLKGSFDSGIIDKEEYEKQKEKLESESKDFDRLVQDINKPQKEEEPRKSSEKLLIVSLALIVILFVSIFAFSKFFKPVPKTLEELHILNLQGKLNPSQGYVYKGVYSFITEYNLWFTQLTSPKGTRIYDLALRYSPRDINDLVIEGTLNTDLFDNQTEFYYTFNPTGKEFQYVTLAVADLITHMTNVFEKTPLAACDRNETDACKRVPVITCENKDKLVLYIKESNKLRVYYNDNCIVIEGNGLDLVKGVDRVLYNLYKIMEQEEV